MITTEEIKKEFLELGYTELELNRYMTWRDEYLFDIDEFCCILRVWTIQGQVGDIKRKVDRINGLFINSINDLRFIMKNLI